MPFVVSHLIQRKQFVKTKSSSTHNIITLLSETNQTVTIQTTQVQVSILI